VLAHSRGRIESAKSVGGSDMDDLDGDSGKGKRFCNGGPHEPPLPIAQAPNCAQEPRDNSFHEVPP